MKQEWSDVCNRLDKLEVENRRLKRTAGLFGALGLLGLALGAAAPVLCDVVSAERFVLRDENGRQRITFDAYHTGTPAVSFLDKRGKPLAKFAVDDEGVATLNLFDKAGASSSTYRIAPDGAKAETKTAQTGSQPSEVTVH